MLEKKKVIPVCVAIFLVMSTLAFTGCIEEDEEDIVIAQRHEPEDFHPIRYTDVYTSYVFIQMYDQLISTYPDGEPNTDADHAVAEDFEWSDDLKELTVDMASSRNKKI